MTRLSQYLTPKVRRFGIVLGTALILVSLIFATSKRQDATEQNTTKPGSQTVDFTGVPPKELTINRISADLERIHQQQQDFQQQHQQELAQLLQEVQQLKSAAPAPSRSNVDSLSIEPVIPAPDVLSWNHYQQASVSDAEQAHLEMPPQPPKAIRVLSATYYPVSLPETKPKDTPKLLRLPAGSILSGQLITGLDVPTGQGARREPYPVLVRIKASAILPNHYRTNVRECFVLASGYGDLSSERAYLRSETLSCIFKREGKEQVIERPLEGYLSGEDGKAGLRGRLVSKQGQIMAKAAMAGFLGGVSEAFDIKPVPVFSVVPGKNGEIQSPFQSGLKGSEALQSSLIKGSNKALEKLADFYMKLADQMVPVIEISAERKVDLILTRGLKN